MGKKGKIVAIIGASIGILSVLLSLILPIVFSWYCYRISGGGYSGSLYLTALGSSISDDFGSSFEVVILVLIGGILVLAGAALCLVGVVKEIKTLGIIGAILMIFGPTMLIYDLAGQVSDFAQTMNLIATSNDGNVFYHRFDPSPGVMVILGIYYGYVIVYAGGILGLIGGASI